MYIHINLCIYVFICEFIYMYVYICMYINMYVHIYVYSEEGQRSSGKYIYIYI
jgi:hypothetical protein